MAATGRLFFAGMATAVLLTSAGFVAGSMVAQKVLKPAPVTPTSAVDRLPPARVVLPPLNAGAAPPSFGPEASAPPPSPEQLAPPQPKLIPAKDGSSKKHAEKEKQAQSPTEDEQRAERAGQGKAEAAERQRRAERKAKRDAARAKQQREQQLQQHQLREAARQQSNRPGILAFDDEDKRPSSNGFFGN
jgi:type IV secretory pathway VirB10-like protein